MLLGSISTIRGNLVEAADGASQLTDGATRAADGATQLGDGCRAARRRNGAARGGRRAARRRARRSSRRAPTRSPRATRSSRHPPIAWAPPSATPPPPCPQVRDDIAARLAEAGVDQATIDDVLARLDPVGDDLEAGNARVQEVVGQIDQLADGSAQVADGSAALAAGARTAADGAATAATGAAALRDGSARSARASTRSRRRRHAQRRTRRRRRGDPRLRPGDPRCAGADDLRPDRTPDIGAHARGHLRRGTRPVLRRPRRLDRHLRAVPHREADLATRRDRTALPDPRDPRRLADPGPPRRRADGLALHRAGGDPRVPDGEPARHARCDGACLRSPTPRSSSP